MARCVPSRMRRIWQTEAHILFRAHTSPGALQWYWSVSCILMCTTLGPKKDDERHRLPGALPRNLPALSRASASPQPVHPQPGTFIIVNPQRAEPCSQASARPEPSRRPGRCSLEDAVDVDIWYTALRCLMHTGILHTSHAVASAARPPAQSGAMVAPIEYSKRRDRQYARQCTVDITATARSVRSHA